RLEDAGFRVTFGQPVPSIRYAARQIAKEDPPPGTSIHKGEVVRLQVSTGPPPRIVPSVKGLRVAAAKDELSRRGLVPDVVLRFSQTVPKGEVIEQRPAAAARAHYGDTVQVFVSKGPEPVLVPQVVGQG